MSVELNIAAYVLNVHLVLCSLFIHLKHECYGSKNSNCAFCRR